MYGLYTASFEMNIISPQINIKNSDFFFDYSGAVHVQTNSPNKEDEIKDIFLQANDIDLDFLIFNQLNTYTKNKNLDGYFENTLIIEGSEFSYKNSRLLLISDNQKKRNTSAGQTQLLASQQLSEPNSQNSSTLILSHPLRERFQWYGDLPIGLSGLELFNVNQIWAHNWNNSKFSFLWSLLYYPFNPSLSATRLFKKPSLDELTYWDKVLRKRELFAITGVNATPSLRLFGMEFPSYSTLLNVMRNHLLLKSELTGDEEKDSKRIKTALKKGQFYISLDVIGNPKGFASYIKDEDDKIFPMGSKINLKSSPISLIVKLPSRPLVPFRVLIFKDGKKMIHSDSIETVLNIYSPGTYRAIVEVLPDFPIPEGKKWISWIYTNPFFIN